MSTPNCSSVFCSGGSYLRNMLCKLFTFSGKTNTSINEVLFYGAGDEGEIHQTGLNNLLCIYYLVLHAGQSIDVCVPSLTSTTMIKCLIRAQQRKNVKIRIIIHSSGDFRNLQILAKNGIEVKVANSVQRLEHDFILIDASGETDAVAIMGSIDYETNRVNCNMDSTLLTSEKTVVKSMKREFDRVWCSVASDKPENEDKKEV